MTLALVLVTPVALVGCLLAGALPGDRGLALLRCWWKIRYATNLTELAVGVTGTLTATAFYIMTGMGRLIMLFGGVLTIVTEVVTEKTGRWLPTYRANGTEKEIEQDGFQ